MFLSEFLDYPESVVKLARVTGSEALEAIFMLCVCVCACACLCINMEGYWLMRELKLWRFCFSVADYSLSWTPAEQPAALFCSHLSQWWQDSYTGDWNNAFTACLGSIYFLSMYWQNDARSVLIYSWFYLSHCLNPPELYSYYEINWLKEIRLMVLTKHYIRLYAYTHTRTL